MKLKLAAMAGMVGALYQEAGAEGSTGGAAVKKPKTEVEMVSMTDGRQIGFPGKRKLQKEVIIENDKVGVRLDFRNGETRTFFASDDLLLPAAGHGLSQKLGDETAGVEDIDDQVLAVDELIDRLTKQGADGWKMEREASGLAGTSVLLKALVEVMGKTPDVVKEFLKGKTQAEKLALRNSPKVKPAVDRIEAEKSAKAAKVDTDALLAQLESPAA